MSESIDDKPYPYVHPDANGRTHEYALCPYCQNPIELFGLYSGEAGVYGRHTMKSVPGLARWNQDRYRRCPCAERKYNSRDG